ncbi:MAG: hypothetical protein ACLSDQ_11590, partial [Adlercreutzia equolifaciens]
LAEGRPPGRPSCCARTFLPITWKLCFFGTLGKCAYLFSENPHFDLIKLKKYQVKPLFKKAHFPSSQPPISRPLYFMGVFGSRSQEGRDLLR